MGITITEKILADASGVESSKAGEILWVKVDKAMMDDILGPRVEIDEKLKESPIDEEFASKFHGGDIIVAENNFGSGSSRETAPLALTYLGVKVIVA